MLAVLDGDRQPHSLKCVDGELFRQLLQTVIPMRSDVVHRILDDALQVHREAVFCVLLLLKLHCGDRINASAQMLKC